MKKFILIALLVSIIAGGRALAGSTQKAEERAARIAASAKANEPKLKEIFQGKVSFGMTYQQVVQIIGAPPFMTQSLVYKGGEENLCTFVLADGKTVKLHFINKILVNLIDDNK
jgi:hypothetical protein